MQDDSTMDLDTRMLQAHPWHVRADQVVQAGLNDYVSKFGF